MLMPEQISHPAPRPNQPRRLSRVTTATASLLAVGIVGGAGLINNANKNNTIRNKNGELRTLTARFAGAQALNFTASLYDKIHYPDGVPMPILNGEIHSEGGIDGKVKTTIKDPILLASDPFEVTPDVRGDFLRGAWLGVQNSDQQGHVIITATQYDPSKDTFKSFTHSPTDVILQNVGVYVTNATNSPDYLVAFDPTGNTSPLLGEDGTPVQPGLVTATK